MALQSSQMAYYFVDDASFTTEQRSSINLILRRMQDSIFQLLNLQQAVTEQVFLFKRIAATQSLTGSYVNVNTLFFNLPGPGRWLITMVIYVSSGAGAIPQFQLTVDGKAQVGTPLVNEPATSSSPVVCQWLVASIAGGEKVVLQGKNAGASTATVLGVSTLTCVGPYQ